MQFQLFENSQVQINFKLNEKTRIVTSLHFTFIYLTLPQGEKGGISVPFARYKSSVDKCDGAQKQEIQNYEQLDLVKQMEDALQDGKYH